jgi:hypothetical protein
MDQKVLDDIRGKRILFSPLNWGWGHVSRSIPLLKNLTKQNNELIIACDLAQKQVYLAYKVEAKFLEHHGYPFRFKGRGRFEMDFLTQFYSLNRFKRREKKLVEIWVDQFSIDLVLSDHRYGFRSEKVKSVFITHQYTLPFSPVMNFGQKMHESMIHRFDEVWLVDKSDHSLAGKLSRGNYKIAHRYLGNLSRFDNGQQDNRQQIDSVKSDFTLILVSGPEPYAEQFLRSQLIRMAQNFGNYKVFYSNAKYKLPELKGVEFHLTRDWKDLDHAMMTCSELHVACGYTTLMDLAYLSCKAILYPTKGQAEQEYLYQLQHSRK